jgi:hypothetical protein
MKTCKTCKQPDKKYWKSLTNGESLHCTDCSKIDRVRIKREKEAGTFVSMKGKPRLSEAEKEVRKIEMIQYQKEYREENKKALSAQKLDAQNRAKEEGLEIYGGKCTCCGESQREFLTIEHKNGRDKNIKRRTGKGEWARLKAKGWPDDITIYCFNCNCAKGAYGSCPHSWTKE